MLPSVEKERRGDESDCTSDRASAVAPQKNPEARCMECLRHLHDPPKRILVPISVPRRVQEHEAAQEISGGCELPGALGVDVVQRGPSAWVSERTMSLSQPQWPREEFPYERNSFSHPVREENALSSSDRRRLSRFGLSSSPAPGIYSNTAVLGETSGGRRTVMWPWPFSLA